VHSYLKQSLKGFWICFGIAFLASFIEPVPWENQMFGIGLAYFCFSGAFLAVAPNILHNMYVHEGIWIHPRFRWLGVSVIGACVGLFVLGWVAVLGPKGLEQVRTEDLEFLLCGRGPEDAWTQARHLIPRAELLGMCKILLENGAQFAIVFAAISALGAWMHDQLAPPANSSET
jgi:hypothetical protein